jgi:hypothetical protein
MLSQVTRCALLRGLQTVHLLPMRALAITTTGSADNRQKFVTSKIAVRKNEKINKNIKLIH